MVNKLITVALVVLLLSACKDNNQSEIQEQLNLSKALWNQHDIKDYQVTSRLFCFCIINHDIVNIVDNGDLVSAFYAGSGHPIPADQFVYQKSVQDYFDLIQDAIDENAFSIDVSYDPTYGYPVDIGIDYDQNMADEEVGYRLSSFEIGIEDILKPELEVEFVLKDQFNQSTQLFIQGEPITFAMTITNNSSVDSMITFPSSQQFDFYITDLAGNEFWRWSDDLAFTYAYTDMSILAGESIEIIETWDQQLSDTDAISNGEFIVLGSLLEQSETATSNLTIE
jgi:hypothetical protein